MAVPRLTDVFGLGFTQEDVDFAIPKLDEDIPLYIDPFLLWNSEKPEYVEQHKQLVGFFDLVREHVQSASPAAAASRTLAPKKRPLCRKLDAYSRPA